MKVKELIEKLRTMPQEKDIVYYYDSAPRGIINDVVENTTDKVVLLNNYFDSDRESAINDN